MLEPKHPDDGEAFEEDFELFSELFSFPNMLSPPRDNTICPRCDSPDTVVLNKDSRECQYCHYIYPLDS